MQNEIKDLQFNRKNVENACVCVDVWRVREILGHYRL